MNDSTIILNGLTVRQQGFQIQDSTFGKLMSKSRVTAPLNMNGLTEDTKQASKQEASTIIRSTLAFQ